MSYLAKMTALTNNYSVIRVKDKTTSNTDLKKLLDDVNEYLESKFSKDFSNITFHCSLGTGLSRKSRQVFYFFDERETEVGTRGVYPAIVVGVNPDEDDYATFSLYLTQGYANEKESSSDYKKTLRNRSQYIADKFCTEAVNNYGFNVCNDEEDGSYTGIIEKSYSLGKGFDEDIFEQDVARILQIYSEYVSQDFESGQEQFNRSIDASKSLSQKQRLERLKKADKKPKIEYRYVSVFKRNPDVVAEVLVRANGVCERKKCGEDAPFIKLKDGTGYLEVHHKVRLADGGDDSVENAEALCPNCHRESHFG